MLMWFKQQIRNADVINAKTLAHGFIGDFEMETVKWAEGRGEGRKDKGSMGRAQRLKGCSSGRSVVAAVVVEVEIVGGGSITDK
jgi:hypothetical protein